MIVLPLWTTPGYKHGLIDENCTQWLSGGIPFRVNFQSRVCSGTKANYVCLNDPYLPYENWEVFDAKLTALVSNGKTEIKVKTADKCMLPVMFG